MTIPPGLIITAILVVNNLRDLGNDRKRANTHWRFFWGASDKTQYLICMIAAYLVLPLAAWMGVIPWSSLLAWSPCRSPCAGAPCVYGEVAR